MLSEACSLSTESAILVSKFPFGLRYEAHETREGKRRKTNSLQGKDIGLGFHKTLTSCRFLQWLGWCRECQHRHQFRVQASYGES